MTAGIDVYSREIRYEGQFTQASIGGNLVFGFQVMPYARMFVNYSLEQVKVKDLNPLYQDPLVLAGNPFLDDSLLIGEGGRRTISKIGPSYVYNTVDHPIFPTSGTRYTLSMDFGGHRRQHQLLQSAGGGIWYFPIGANRRTSLGLPRPGGVHHALRQHDCAADLREAVPRRRVQHARVRPAHRRAARSGRPGSCIGGNKSLLFNVEYLITIAGPVRLVLFYDAGQVRDRGQNFAWKEPVTQSTYPRRAASPIPGRFLSRFRQPVPEPLPSGDRRHRRDAARSRRRPAPKSGSSCRC